MACLVSLPSSGAYSASKAAAVASAKALRGELASAAPNISVVLLNPGMVKTNLIRTSAIRQTDAMSTAAQDLAHAALNNFGIEPSAAARWVIDAIDADRFWVLPPADDMFSSMLAEELAELRGPIG